MRCWRRPLSAFGETVERCFQNPAPARGRPHIAARGAPAPVTASRPAPAPTTRSAAEREPDRRRSCKDRCTHARQIQWPDRRRPQVGKRRSRRSPVAEGAWLYAGGQSSPRSGDLEQRGRPGTDPPARSLDARPPRHQRHPQTRISSRPCGKARRRPSPRPRPGGGAGAGERRETCRGGRKGVAGDQFPGFAKWRRRKARTDVGNTHNRPRTTAGKGRRRRRPK